ncbi:hypothetical protein V6O07_12680, partial [Arthrospira platensis SPKY2]
LMKEKRMRLLDQPPGGGRGFIFGGLVSGIKSGGGIVGGGGITLPPSEKGSATALRKKTSGNPVRTKVPFEGLDIVVPFQLLQFTKSLLYSNLTK